MTLWRNVLVVTAVLWGSVAFGQPTATITRNGNLRPTPSTSRPAIRVVMSGETVTLINVNPVNGYYHVRTSQGERGWIYRSAVTLGPATLPPGPPPAPPPASLPPPPPPTLNATCGPGIEVVVNQSCPAVGTRGQSVPYPANSDAGLRNLAKRHVPDASCTSKPLSLDDVRSMQNYIDTTYADARMTKTQFAPTRSLKNIATFDGNRSEGDLVTLVAYLTVAKDEHPESVNCAGADGLDVHINIGPKSTHPSEFDGIVAEMIPQLPRPTGWDTATLNRLAGKQVLVVGGLSYDNEHLVNDNAANPKKGQPARFSLWEIHPITAFYVCPQGDGCNPTQLGEWVTLTSWATSHP